MRHLRALRLLPADTRWWATVQEHLRADFSREDGTRTWATFELAVRKARLGIAATLHASLLADLKVERATLTARPRPEAKAAQAAYATRGYRELGLSHPWDDAPFYTAMVLDLPQSPT